ncbi:MAG TPA: hypothetical protein DIT01_17185 [Lentisphaeria bacterium]|nr:hypothetical protein [Lentisphaeria bacterium]|tara:strand:- start:1555 stop:2157 length:603 start_codon:yes stop_codon:yes gene_type:complete
MEENLAECTIDVLSGTFVLELRRLLSSEINRNTIHELRQNIVCLCGQLKKHESLPPESVNEIAWLMQEVYQVEEQFLHSGLRNVEGAPQLLHDLLLVLAILPEVLDMDAEENLKLPSGLTLYDWLIEFKDSDRFDRHATHPLSLSHVVIRALIFCGLDADDQYDVDNVFRRIAVAVFRREIHYSYFDYAARYVQLKFCGE